jgi:predicted transcriptional regulator of viral defense system
MPRISEILQTFETKGPVNVRLDAVARAAPEASEGALRQALHRQELRGRLVRLSRGSDHWLIVPLQYAAAGAPPLEMWLHQYLEKTLRLSYYVGLLSAAESYGVAPYGVMVTQVVVEAPRRPLDVGRHRIVFVTRRDTNAVPTRWHETPNGRFRISTPEVTALDLIRRMSIVGGMPRVRDTLEGLYQHFPKEGLEAALEAGGEAATAPRRAS